MNPKIFFIAVLTVLVSCGQGGRKQSSAANNDQTAAIEMLRVFYTLYITECDKMTTDEKAVASIKNKYLTKELSARLSDVGLEYDPFLNAQDCDKAWIETLEIAPETDRENAYKVCYRYDNEHKNCITLYLAKDNGRFLINDIRDLSNAFMEKETFDLPND